MFECIKTGAHVRLWNNFYCLADVFDMGGCLLFQCMKQNDRPFREMIHFHAFTYEKTYTLSGASASRWIFIVKADDVQSYGYDGRKLKIEVKQ